MKDFFEKLPLKEFFEKDDNLEYFSSLEKENDAFSAGNWMIACMLSQKPSIVSLEACCSRRLNMVFILKECNSS